MKWFLSLFILVTMSCKDGNINLPATKTTYYTTYLIYNASSEKIFFTCKDHFPNETYHDRIYYIDTNKRDIIFMTHFLSKQDYDQYNSCVYLDSIIGETYISKKKLITPLINPARWEMQIVNGNHTITKAYTDTLFDNDFQ